ncbi:MAG TPA: hypothetical protein PKD96_02030 [Candidatus Absconditabacterales bacterium]|nr:hypothetical protein [Candidatus Absconditabacterales bacterium]HMT27058.1 hypothetical protein [Candidatus Absconditabacterales bacterium]
MFLRKKIVLKKISLLGLFFLLNVSVFAQEQSQVADFSLKKGMFVTDLTRSISQYSQEKTKKGIVKIFCSAVLQGENLSAGFLNYDQGGSAFYKPGNSVFLYSLCGQIGYADTFFHPSLSSYVKNSSRSKVVTNLDAGCNPDGSMNACNFRSLVPGIFNALMNEYGDLKVSSLFGYGDKPFDELVTDFSDRYFGKGSKSIFGAKLCGDDGIYVRKNTLSESQSDQCSHPKTYALLLEYIKNSKKITDKLDFLNAREIMSKSNLRCSEADLLTSSFDPLACAFTNNENHWTRFLNLIYNELFFYSLFSTFYSHILSQDAGYSDLSLSSNVVSGLEKNAQEIRDLHFEIAIGREAVSHLQRMVGDVFLTFPIHIGLMIYYEDLLAFRKSLVQIYTPLHQLYFKLRNVQEK